MKKATTLVNKNAQKIAKDIFYQNQQDMLMMQDVQDDEDMSSKNSKNVNNKHNFNKSSTTAHTINNQWTNKQP